MSTISKPLTKVRRMTMRALVKGLLVPLATLLLASCGGGGGSDSDSGFNPPGLRVAVTTQSASTTPNSLVGVTVRVDGPNGQPLSDGTEVTLRVSPPGVGLVSTLQTGTTVPPNAGGSATLGESVVAILAGGVANFRFHSRQVGSANLTASVIDPNAPARTVTGSANVSVVAGPPNDPRLTLQAVTTTLPVNPSNVDPFVGSPYLTEVTITWRNLDGTLVVPRDDDDFVGVSVNPVNPSGGFSTLDDAETDDVNEFIVRLGQGPVDVVSGKATVFFHSFDLPATATMTATAVDQITGEVLSAQQTFTITSGTPALPASVLIGTNNIPVYTAGSGGNTNAGLEIAVFDGAAAFVPNPAAGANNVQVEIVGGSIGGERLAGVNAAGQNVFGEQIRLRTNNGLAGGSYQSGSRQGVVTIRATADRSDNNVDNGITDPVSSTRGIVVSDGRLFDVRLTSPVVNAIFVNPALGPDDEGVVVELPGDQEIEIPFAPDGTYSLTVSALATDRQGNPVVPGTEIRFGSIDHPKADDGFFAISGNDGNPQEAGTTFTAPTGAFTTAGGGAGPGDTVVVFGEESNGNRDLESARTVSTVNGPTSLTVDYRFNRNDDTGNLVDNGPVLPYVIGRATSGNISTSALTNDLGVARTQLNYPVSRLGTLAAIWAQGSGDIQNGTAELVTDAEFVSFAGVAPGTLVAEPSQIPGNTTTSVTVCVRDALQVGISGLPISFAFQNLSGTGTIDGQNGSGVLANTTGLDGCVTANVTTTGVTPPASGGAAPSIIFSFGGLSDTVAISVGQLILQAIPSGFVGDGVATVRLRLLDAGGQPVNGVQLVGNCTATAPGLLTIVTQPGITGGGSTPGETTARVQATGFLTANETPPTGSCTFTTPTGSPSVIVSWTGFDQCLIDVSPDGPCAD